jgi:hypothetical protein
MTQKLLVGVTDQTMKAGAAIVLIVAHVTNTSGFTSEVALSSLQSIVTSVTALYRSTSVNILYHPTATRGK